MVMDMAMQGGQQGYGSNNGMPDWLMQMFGGAGSAAGSFFGGRGKNPADTANSYINQIPGKTQQYYQPYMDAGKGAMGDLQNQYKDLLSGNVQNKLGENFKESPGYQFKLQQAMNAGNAANAAGGSLGTPMHQQQNMQLANDIGGADYNDYIKNQMGLYGLGLGGEEGINKMGFDASGNYANTLANTLGQQAAYGYQGQNAMNQADARRNSGIFSGLGMAAGGLFGGPAGAAFGKWFGNQFGG